MIIEQPFNYSGGKQKVIEQIKHLFPENINAFVDLFAGSGIVSANTKANYHIINDKCFQFVNLLHCLYLYDTEEIIEIIDKTIEIYGLGKENKEEFLLLRECYNENPIIISDLPQVKSNLVKYISFLCLIYYSFNYNFVFTIDNKFSVPSGYGRSSFNSNLRTKLIDYCIQLKTMNVQFYSWDFKDVINYLQNTYNELKYYNKEKEFKNNFIFIDPPYILAKSSCMYSRTKYLRWTEEHEKLLYGSIDKLVSETGIKFGLTNMLKRGNEEVEYNTYLLEFSKKYNVEVLRNNYNNCSYQKEKVHHEEIYVYN